MSQELIHVIDQISKEKGISKEMVVEAVESALVSAAKKKYGAQRIAVQIDPKRGDIIMYAYKKVVAEVSNPDEEITLEEAQTLYPDAQMEGEVPLQVEFHKGEAQDELHRFCAVSFAPELGFADTDPNKSITMHFHVSVQPGTADRSVTVDGADFKFAHQPVIQVLLYPFTCGFLRMEHGRVHVLQPGEFAVLAPFGPVLCAVFWIDRGQPY